MGGPRLLLLSLVWVLVRGTRSHHDRPSPLQCYGVGPVGDLTCSWETWGVLEAPANLHLQSRKYHSNRNWEVPVPPGQSWVIVPREQLTASDQLLIWGVQGGDLLWPAISVNLETRMKPDAPSLAPEVDFLEEESLEAIIQWTPPTWPRHKDLVCQFYYQGCGKTAWTLVEPPLSFPPLAPLEIRDLCLASSYKVQGHCRLEQEEDLWSEDSATLSFQTPPSAPKDVWLSGRVCGPPGGPDPVLLWKAPGSYMQGNYTVSFQLEDDSLSLTVTPCCSTPIPTGTKVASVSAADASSWESVTNLSLVCLAPDSAPRNLEVHRGQREGLLQVAWLPGTGKPQEYVVDWAPESDSLGDLNWVRLPRGTLSAGLSVPLEGPKLHRLQDAPSGSPVITWDEVPRSQLRGHLTHYTLCTQSRAGSPLCRNVSGSVRTIILSDLPWGSGKLWMRASTVAGLGPPGPSLRFHLPDNTQRWKVLLGVLVLWCVILLGCVLCFVTARRCSHLRHKVLPRWVWERAPDPANSSWNQSHMEEIPQAQPPGDLPFLEVEETEPLSATQSPQTSCPPLNSGYEKHFLPTPEELGLLGPPSQPRQQVLA
ncbi:interleukin-27 receptor subunit alpha isoform X2 [Erinaceus europaeus]|uniref:Interleukin-27 receptor subunit alpha isoform X2 n=1 Tax=Erinaceus europaeus TaxID=9365 RepID=A0ABM3WMQ2_ERIEU|nr:interleukin-27 receptor subunit alpha isoform X2 [Erinaceus europaeus]